jgi:hypothetical protein
MTKGKIIRMQGCDDSKKLGIDEIVAEKVDFHLERMNDGQLWIGVDYAKNRRLSIQLQATSKGILEAIVEDEET